MPARFPEVLVVLKSLLCLALWAHPAPAPSRAPDEMLRSASSAIEKGEWSRAEEKIKKALRLSPRHFEGLCLMTQFLREQGRLRESLAYADILQGASLAGVSSENRLERFLQRAETLMSLGAHGRAEADARKALRESPESFASLWLMARCLLEQGKAREALGFAERMVGISEGALRAKALAQRALVRLSLADPQAQEDLRQALEADPGEWTALWAMTRFLRDKGRAHEALAFAERLKAAAQGLGRDQRSRAFVQTEWELVQSLVERSQVLSELKDFSRAEEDLRQALALAPENLEALRAMTRLRLVVGQPEQALQAARRLVAAARSRAEQAQALLERAEIRRRLKDPGALSDLRRAMSLEPSSFPVLQALARHLLERGRFQEALAYAGKARGAARDSDERSALVLKARTLRAMGRAVDAEKALREALKDSEDPEALDMLSELLLERGRLSEALDHAERLARLEGGPRAGAYVQRARILAALKDYGRAEEDLRKALEIGEDPVALGAMARFLLERGRAQEALSFAERLVSAQPGPEALLERARVLLGLGQDQRAEQDLRRALEEEPRSPVALQALAEFLLERSRAGEALEFAARLLRVARDGTLKTMARALLDLGRTQEALAYAQRAARAARSAEERTLALALKARVLRALGRVGDAEKDLRKALEASEDPLALEMLSELLLERGRLSEALDHAERLPRLEGGQRAGAYVHRARILVALKDYGRAEEDLKRALELGGEEPAVLRAMARFLLERGRAGEALTSARPPT